jgi:hypothetical protein
MTAPLAFHKLDQHLARLTGVRAHRACEALGRRLWHPQETVVHVFRVNVVSGDSARLVDAVRKGPLFRPCGPARSGSIERDEFAPGTTQETMVHIVRINVVARDSPRLADAVRNGPLS